MSSKEAHPNYHAAFGGLFMVLAAQDLWRNMWLEPTSPGIQVEIWMSNQDMCFHRLTNPCNPIWTIAIHRPWNIFQNISFCCSQQSRNVESNLPTRIPMVSAIFSTGGSNALLWTDLGSSQGLERARQHESLMLFNFGLSQNIPQIHSFLQKEISPYCAEELAYHSISVSVVEPKQGGV